MTPWEKILFLLPSEEQGVGVSKKEACNVVAGE